MENSFESSIIEPQEEPGQGDPSTDNQKYEYSSPEAAFGRLQHAQSLAELFAILENVYEIKNEKWNATTKAYSGKDIISGIVAAYNDDLQRSRVNMRDLEKSLEFVTKSAGIRDLVRTFFKKGEVPPNSTKK